jgi:type II secretion system protein N
MKLDLSRLAKVRLELTGWRRTAAYALFFAVAFVFALHRTFPIDAVKDRLVLEAAAQGWQLRMNDLSHHGLAGIHARELTLQTRDGARIPVEELSASLRPFPLLAGRRAVDFDARLFDGRLTGATEEGGTVRRLRARAEGIDLARAAVLRRLTGLDLAGSVSGDVDLTLDGKDPSKSAGSLALTVRNAAIQGGEVQVPGMGGALTVPRVALGTVSVRGAVRGGRLELDKLDARGDDVDLSADQLFVQLQPRLEFSPLSGRVRLKLQDAFWQRGAAAGLRPVVDAAVGSARAPDGAYGFQVYGTLGRPQVRPQAP